ncbi:MAG: hypothetical protein ABSF81_18165 [Bacteroidales bacterium]|jgi:hypothetical protein
MKTKTLEKYLLFLVVALSTGVLFISCQKDEISFPDPSTLLKGLTGSWVEINIGADTISFNSNKESGYFNLYRGFAITNGYWLPKIGSTSYSYTISGDSIIVVDGLSSSMEGGTYYFKFDEPNLTINIGKFSKYISTKKSILTFRKIK